MITTRLLPLAALVATFATPAAAVTLSTPLLAGNGQAGIMFDLVAGGQALTVTVALSALMPAATRLKFTHVQALSWATSPRRAGP